MKYHFARLIIWHRESAFPLLIEDLTYATTDNINHIKVDHPIAETFIAVVSLWSMCCKCLLHSARDKASTIGIIQDPGFSTRLILSCRV